MFTEDSVEKATVNLSNTVNKESPVYGYRVNLAGEGTEGKARVRNPFELSLIHISEPTRPY